MMKLTKIFMIMKEDDEIRIYEGEKRVYSGLVGKCTKNIWCHAYIKDMKFDANLERYIIHVRYL